MKMIILFFLWRFFTAPRTVPRIVGEQKKKYGPAVNARMEKQERVGYWKLIEVFRSRIIYDCSFEVFGKGLSSWLMFNISTGKPFT